MGGILSKLLRWLVYSAATVVIILALLVGLIRLLLPQLPAYQQEVRDAAAAATGFDVQFAQLSASWPLRGPELVLYDVRVIEPSTGNQLARANEVSVGVDLLALLLDRRIAPASVGLTGTRLALLRTATGGFELQGRPLEDWVPDREGVQPELEKIVLRLADIDLSYSDANAPGEPLVARLKELEARLQTDALSVEGLVDISGAQRARVGFSAAGTGTLLGADADVLGADWRIAIDAESLELPPLAELLAGMPTPLTAATGEVGLVARFSGRRPLAAFVDLDLRGLEFRDQEELLERVDLLAGRFEWEQQDPGWLLAATELRIGRDGRIWPRSQAMLSCAEDPDEGSRDCEVSVDYLRLDDIYALLRGVTTRGSRAQVFPTDVRGELRDLRLSLREPAAGQRRFNVNFGFADLGLIDLPGGLTVAGLTGEVVADEAGGRLELASGATKWQLPTVFENPLQGDSLSGLLVWRVTDNGVRILSDSVDVSAGEISGSSRFELVLPADGSSPFMDLDARVRASAAPDVLEFLPLKRFPPPVSAWLRRAIVAGSVPDSSIRWRGPLLAFPYERGEGMFRIDLTVTDGVLEFADNWPSLESLTANIVFDGVSMSTQTNQGRFANVTFENQSVRFDDLRNGLLAIDIEQPTAVMELRDLLLAMPIAESLGSVLSRIRGQGDIDSAIGLQLPVTRPGEYELNGRFDTTGSALGFEGLAFQLDDIRGTIRLSNTRLSADELDATLLGEPVKVSLRPAGREHPGHSHFALLASRTPVERWLQTLELPLADKFAGYADWRGMVLLPSGGPASSSLKVMVKADLAEVQSGLPPPFTTVVGESTPLALQLDIQDGVLDLSGQLREDVAWVLRLESGPQGWEVERGALHSGYGPALLPVLPGVELSGRLSVLRLSDWLAVYEGGGAQQRWLELYREVAFSIDELVVFGQRFPDAEIFATRQPGAWRVALDAPWALGTVVVPDEPTPERPLQISMERLWLIETEGGDGEPADPRVVPPIVARADEFRLGELRFGSLDATVASTADGLVASPIKTRANSFQVAGDAAWLVLNDDLNQQRTRLRGELVTDDVKPTLVSLGYQPLMEGKSGQITADISWPGPPAADFLTAASGQVQMRVKDGALLEVEPGGSGRVLGMLSVAALPRRLALDFSDVFDEGLSFDRLQGNFTLESGEAYTCNLGLEGAVADLGIVGRTSMKEQTYDQLAVVRPHVSNVLALGGAVVGGPGVGAAMFLISRIFRKPLSQVGESYYEIQGGWDAPDIGKVQRLDVDTARFSNCEALLPEVLPEVVLVPLPDADRPPVESPPPSTPLPAAPAESP